MTGSLFYLGWILRNFRQGKVGVSSGLTLYRRDDPILFWIYSIFLIGLATVLTALLGYIWWQGWV